MGSLALHVPVLLVSWALGDVVVLKNGNEIQGEILKREGGRIVVRFPGGILELQEKQVAEVRRQSRFDYLLDEGEKRLRRGEEESAVDALTEAVKEDPDSTRARKALLAARESHARSLEELGRYGEAKTVLEALLEADPGNPAARREIQVIDGILAEARKEEERGKEEIEKGQPEKGIWRLQRIFEKFPDRRKAVAEPLGKALIAEGDKLLAKGDWTGAEGLYQRALSTEPELVPLLRRQLVHVKARQIEPALRAGDFAAVERLALEGLGVDPASRALRFYKGLALEGQARAREASEEYLALTEGKRPADLEAAVSRLRLEAEAKIAEEGTAAPAGNPRAREVLSGGFRELRTQHFMVAHKNHDVAREVAFVAERSYLEIYRALGCTTHLRTPIRVQIFPTKDEYVAASGLQSWSGGAHTIGRKMGALSEHTIYSFQDQPRLTTGVLPHEVAHALLAHRLNYPDEIPLWANEGFAVLQEPAHLHEYYRRILRQEASRRTLIPIADIVQRKGYPEDGVDLFYGQCFSLVDFLVSLEGLGTFAAFTKTLCDRGSSLDGALRRHYGIAGADALENRWRSWLDASRR